MLSSKGCDCVCKLMLYYLDSLLSCLDSAEDQLIWVYLYVKVKGGSQSCPATKTMVWFEKREGIMNTDTGLFVTTGKKK